MEDQSVVNDMTLRQQEETWTTTAKDKNIDRILVDGYFLQWQVEQNEREENSRFFFFFLLDRHGNRVMEK